jgi:FkbM family methyltransferase
MRQAPDASPHVLENPMKMESLQQTVSAAPLNEIRALRALQWLYQLAPLEHRLFPLLRPFIPRTGLIAVPFAGGHLLRPAAWVGAYTAGHLFDLERVFPECHLFQAVLARAKPGIVVDVGANLGVYTMLAAEISVAPVIAYEPSPFTACLLKRTLDMNGLTGVEVRQTACGDRPGRVRLQEGINSYVSRATEGDRREGLDFEQLCRHIGEESMAVDVDQVTLDEDLAAEREIALIKIDCEGFEHRILLGARTVLAEKRPTLFIELHPQLIGQVGGNTPTELCRFLQSLSYDVECWNFHTSRSAGPVRRIVGRYRVNPGHRYRDVDTMLADIPRTSAQQLYLVATPSADGRRAVN